MLVPTVGRLVHYVARGSADGRYASVCRMAFVTEVTEDQNTPSIVGLAVINPTGLFFQPLSDGGVKLHTGQAPEDMVLPMGSRCGYGTQLYLPGTWHVPETNTVTRW
jgi:hypothetical protein